MLHTSYSKNHITFTLFYSDEEYPVQTYWGEYRDLRILIAEKLFLDDFGQCGGMGRCATCMIEISGLNNLTSMERNEAVTLSKTNLTDQNVRLACQIPITNDLANTKITVLAYN